MKKLKSGVIPLLASPQRGGGCVFNRISRSHRSRRSRGGFPFVLNRKTTPASRQRRLRDILLIARPPLLAVMQGGEYAAPKRLDIFFTSRRLKTIKSRLLV